MKPDAERRSARVAPSASGGTAQQTSHPSTEQPEHRNDRRLFCCWAVMLGLVPPKRLVDRVLEDVAEIDAES